MQLADLVCKQLLTGRWKVCLWGNADGHISDWRGCAFRIASLPGQPFRGFATLEEAAKFGLTVFKTEADVREAGKKIAGSHLSDKVNFEHVVFPKSS